MITKCPGASLAAVAAAAALAWAPAVSGAPLAGDTATFVNTGYFVELKKAFGQLEITETMIRYAETDPLVAVLEVFASTPYTLRVELDHADLDGSQLNPNHSRGLDERDPFLFRVTDSEGYPTPWQRGSQPLLLTGQPSTFSNGNKPAEHRVELKLQFADQEGDIFTRARPGTYSATVIFEVEEDGL